MSGLDRLTRFSDRVVDYVATRPDYPAALLDHLSEVAGLAPGAAVLDVGCGTGIFARQLQERGARVVGVEPNADMRAAADGVDCRAGTAEATGVPGGWVDLLTATQAFHWFEPVGFAAECRRVLRPGGSVALVWNSRPDGRSALLDGYEEALRRTSIDYEEVRNRDAIAARLGEFFGALGVPLPARRVFPHHQELDQEGFRRRALSSSYTPPAGHPGRAALLQALDALFAAHARGGRVRLDYDTEVWVARWGG